MNREIELPQLGKATLISTEFLEVSFLYSIWQLIQVKTVKNFFLKLVKQENVSVVMNQDMAPTK